VVHRRILRLYRELPSLDAHVHNLPNTPVLL
jgi:hypothetical protein